MQHFIYPENQYKNVRAHGTFTVNYDHDAFMVKISGGMTVLLTTEAAAMLAGFILSKHPAIVKGDAMAFSLATRACDAIHEPDFTVITPGHELLAKPAVQDTKDDEQPHATHPSPILTEAQYGQLGLIQAAANAPADTGLLHPDQERRLTALREASKMLAGRLNHERLTEWAGWILNGDTLTN